MASLTSLAPFLLILQLKTFISDIFKPKITRQGPIYPNLYPNQLNHELKSYFVNTIIPSHTDIAVGEAFQLYGINPFTGFAWKRKLNDGRYLHSAGGCPISGDNITREGISDLCKEKKRQK